MSEGLALETEMARLPKSFIHQRTVYQWSLSVLFGASLLYNPVGGALIGVWLVGAYSVLGGIPLFIFGI
jgi:uncharacterized membrane protein HdeD (DUF308 family)